MTRKRWWQVIDRTTGEVVPAGQWSVIAETGTGGRRGDRARGIRYTVNFLVYQTWDTTSMYNHIQNNWTTPPVISVDPYHPETLGSPDGVLRQAGWRSTTIPRWCGSPRWPSISASTPTRTRSTSSATGPATRTPISVAALEDFEKRFGYALTAEDFVDQGYYNATYRVPSKGYRDWMTFIQDFTVGVRQGAGGQGARGGQEGRDLLGRPLDRGGVLSSLLPAHRDRHQHRRGARTGWRCGAWPTRPGRRRRRSGSIRTSFPTCFTRGATRPASRGTTG